MKTNKKLQAQKNEENFKRRRIVFYASRFSLPHKRVQQSDSIVENDASNSFQCRMIQ